MIRLEARPLASLQDVQTAVQVAIDLEFATLPPYLYTKFSIEPDSNQAAMANLASIIGQEMVHMCLACNILNAIGGAPQVQPPTYPSPPPGGIGDGLILHLLPFSQAAIEQGMAIEEPDDPIDPPVVELAAAADEGLTIAQYYARVDAALAQLPPSSWLPHRNQIIDNQFFAGQLFEINSYADAQRAIAIIVTEGEGAKNTPLDFDSEVAHYYRFGEIYNDKVLTKADNPVGYSWGPQPLGVDWSAVYPAIPDPCTHDFSQDPPEAQAAQSACNQAYTNLVDALQGAVAGQPGQLGVAVRAMFDLRMAAMVALTTPLADPSTVAGPSFLYIASQPGAEQ